LSLRKYSVGVTLVELMVTLAILSILVAIASPSMDRIIRRNRLDADTERFQSALALARSEAIKRNATVSVIPTTGNYARGWQIVTDSAASLPNCALSTADGELLLRVQDALSPTTGFATAKYADSGVRVDCNTPSAAVNSCISFDSRGAGIGTDGGVLAQTFCLQDTKTPDELYRAISLGRTGQPYLSKVQN
jgi:prepilin-type N-terminal cleavage/methylation domain-containing protein